MEATTSSAVTTTTTPFQSSLRLKTLRSTTASFASALTSLDASEKKYWEEKFGLHRPATSAVVLKAGSASAVHHVTCGDGERTVVVSCGPRVQLYGTTPQSALNVQLRKIGQRQREDEEQVGSFLTSSRTKNPNPEIAAADRQIPTGGQLALFSTFRSDGQLVAVGTEGGVRVAQLATRATLATFHSPFAVRAVAWFRSGKDVLAACEDALRVYRLADAASGGGGRPLRTCRGHGDVVRCGALWQCPSESLAFTGSYDHTVRIWDVTHLDDSSPSDDGCISVLPHGAPVEAIAVLDRSSGEDSSSSTSAAPTMRPWLVSAGGTYLKVWDLLTGACLRQYATHHNKTITSLLVMPRVVQRPTGTEVRMRLLTGGLDGYLGVHAWDPATGALVADVYGVRLGSEGITALGGTPDRLVIGTLSGRVQVRQRAVAVPQKRRLEPRAGTYAFFTRGMNADAVAGDYVVGSEATSKKKKLNDYDLALKQFRYGDALDEALSTKIPQVVIAVLEELGRRRGLTIALSNRDEESLEPVLAFTVRYLARPRFTALLVGVANKLVGIYGDVSGQSETIDELFVKLKQQVSAEARVQRKLLRIFGQIEAVAAAAAANEIEDDEVESI